MLEAWLEAAKLVDRRKALPTDVVDPVQASRLAKQRNDIDRRKEEVLVRAMLDGPDYIGFTLDARRHDSHFVRVHLLVPDISLPEYQRSMYMHHAPVCAALGATWAELKRHIQGGPADATAA